MSGPAIDIVVTTFKRYDELVAALRGVQKQSYENWHCWISEDGGSDKTAQCIAPFLSDSRFSYITGPHAGFPATPRNRAIKAGQAGFVAILDDDDIWLPEKLAKQLDFLEKHPECVMVGTNAFRWQANEGQTPRRDLPLYHTKIPAGRIGFRKLLIENCFIVSSAMIRRSALEQSGLFNEKLDPHIGEDIELWYRLAAVGELWFMAEPLLYYRDLPPNYYSILSGDELTNWIITLLESALAGSDRPSPLQWPENKKKVALLRERINYLRTGPHLLKETGYRLKKFLKIIS